MMAPGSNFTYSRPAMRKPDNPPDATPASDVKIKTEDVDDGWISTSPYTQRGDAKNPIVLDDNDDDEKDGDGRSKTGSEGNGGEDTDAGVGNLDVENEEEEGEEHSTDYSDRSSLQNSVDDDQVQIKREEDDDDYIVTDAWGGHGFKPQDPIVLDDEEYEEASHVQRARPSNFEPARFESVSSSEPDVPHQLPRNPNHVLSQSPLLCSRSSPILSVEEYPPALAQQQQADVDELMEEPEADVRGAFDEPDVHMDRHFSQEDNTENAGRVDHEDLCSSLIESEEQNDPPASPFAAHSVNQHESHEETSEENELNRFVQAWSCINRQGRSAVEAPSQQSVNEETDEPENLVSVRLRGQKQTSLSTPPLKLESRVEDEDDNAVAAAIFADLERSYNAKKAAGTASLEDDIEFMRLRSQEQSRKKRLAEEARALTCSTPEPDDNENDTSDGAPHYNSDLEPLFCTPPPDIESLKRAAGDEEDEEEENVEKEHQKHLLDDSDTDTKPRKRVRRSVDKTASKAASKKRGRPAGIRNSQEKGKKKTSAKRQTKTTDAVTGGRLLNTASFLTADAIRDANANVVDPATYQNPGQEVTRVKREALMRLLASIPLDQRKSAKLDKRDLGDATKKFAGRGACRADGTGGWTVNGMKSALKNHQVLGAGFMRERELGGDLPKGGICADTMGFGKTVMMLANCINDTLYRKRVKEQGPRTTLIVVPSTLVAQWKSEIDKHVKVKENKINVMIYRSGSWIDSNNDHEVLGGNDIVITTYHEVMHSYPKGEPPADCQTREEKAEWWHRHYEKQKGLLHQVKFRRIVLDEAQQIKNYKGRTSIACRLVDAEFKWALSGTPIVNGPLELYAYFKFLNVECTGSFKVFRANYYGDEEPEKLQRLEVMLKRFTIRRTHKDKLFGQPLLRLPKAGEYLHECRFNDIERAVYEIVHKRMIARINSFSRDNTLERNYSNVLIMLLRLRQMTSNLILVETVMRDMLEREDLEKLADLTRVETQADEQKEAQLVGLRRILSENSIENQNDPASSSSQVGTQRHDLPDKDELVNTGRTHGLTYNFKKFLATLRQGKAWEELQARTLCAECRQPPDEPMVTSCYHIFCEPCLELVQHQAALRGIQRARCPECQTEYSRADRCGEYDLASVVQSEEFESDTEVGPSSRYWKRKQKQQKKAKDTTDEEVIESWINLNGSVLPSAKTIAIKAQILNWLEADPNCKIIVYTQFITMIRILGKMCDQEGFGYVEFHGKQSLKARNATIKRFSEKPEAKIMLASLKCGGVGLNLTMASHVISTEPWWNASCESQAFGRVFRIGQTQTCSFTKLIVSNTIDERLIAMQKRKQAQIDSVMGDESAEGKKLTIVELMELFGHVERDGKGRPFIVVENQETIPRCVNDSEDEDDDD